MVKRGERDYQAWLTAHPNAYVLTLARTWRDTPTEHGELHRADCFHMRDYIVGVELQYADYFRPAGHGAGQAPGAIVEQESIKICSVSRAALEGFAQSHREPQMVPSAECNCHRRTRRA